MSHLATMDGTILDQAIETRNDSFEIIDNSINSSSGKGGDQIYEDY